MPLLGDHDLVNQILQDGLTAIVGDQAQVQSQRIGRLAAGGVLVGCLVEERLVQRVLDLLGKRRVFPVVVLFAEHLGRPGHDRCTAIVIGRRGEGGRRVLGSVARCAVVRGFHVVAKALGNDIAICKAVMEIDQASQPVVMVGQNL